MILHDQHVHSEYSEDSIASLLEYYKLATSLGCKYFITTEHLDLDITNQKVDWIADYQLVKLATKTPLFLYWELNLVIVKIKWKDYYKF